jgi:diadenosine tetraphosphate (Ap4A) HIT family hydrolase
VTVNATCDICKIVASDRTLVVDGRYWTIALSPDQGYLGRAFVTLKEHRGSLAQLSPEQWSELLDLISRYENTVKQVFGAELFNWGCFMNDAFKSDEPAPHVHWHVRPRYMALVRAAGVEFIDPNFGHFYNREHHQQVEPETYAQLSKILKEAINAD